MVSLYGKISRVFKKKYGVDPRDIDIKARSGREVMQAMSANFPGFRGLIRKSGWYRISRGDSLTDGKSITEDEVNVKFKETDWHIMPCALGCGGDSGWFGVIAGAILIVAGVVINIYAPGAGTPFIMMGAGMMLGGISQLLFPMPKAPGDRGSPDERASYIFDGPRNTAEPGVAVPIAYGETWIGSIIASAGLKIEEAR